MKRRLLPLVLGALAVTASAQNVQFGRTQLSAGINLINVEVATSNAQRQQGLMFREKMPANAGMIFVFDDPATQCMWMKNTLIPLSVAFIDTEGKIVNVEDMQPQTLESHCSKKPVKFALEMNLGWFEKHHLKPGSVIDGLVTPAAK